jgi:putative lipoprotein
MARSIVLVLAALLFTGPALAGIAADRAGVVLPPDARFETVVADAAEPIGLEGVEWRLIGLGDAPVAAADGPPPTLHFDTAAHRFGGSSGCNRVTGGYATDGDSLALTAIAGTRMACLHGMEMEQHFLASLDQVRAWQVGGHTLTLADAAGKKLLVFEAK